MDIAIGISTVIFTAALVIITGFYALQTRRMVYEMHGARGASIRPNVSLHIKHLGGGSAFVILENTGVGPAMDLDVTLTYSPAGPTHTWKTSVMPIGEQARFFIRDLLQDHDTITLAGTCRDAMGEVIPVSGAVQVKEFWDLSTQAQLLLEDDPAAKTATEIEKIRHSLERLASELERPGRERRLRSRQKNSATSERPKEPKNVVGEPIVVRKPRARARREQP